MRKLVCFIVILLTIPIFSQQVEWKTVSWDSASALSDEINLGGTNKPIIFAVDSGFVQDSISFAVFVDNLGASGTWCNLYDESGNEIISKITTTVDFAIALKPQLFAGVSRIKIRLGPSSNADDGQDTTTGSLGIREY